MYSSVFDEAFSKARPAKRGKGYIVPERWRNYIRGGLGAPVSPREHAGKRDGFFHVVFEPFARAKAACTTQRFQNLFLCFAIAKSSVSRRAVFALCCRYDKLAQAKPRGRQPFAVKAVCTLSQGLRAVFEFFIVLLYHIPAARSTV